MSIFHSPADLFIASGQLIGGDGTPPKPDRRNVNCRNCGSPTHKIEIVDYEVVLTCTHCGTTESIDIG